MRRGRLRVRLRRVRWAAAELWSESIDPLDRLVARVILRSQWNEAAQMKLLRVWLALR